MVLEAKYDITINHMEYNSFVHSIPKEWLIHVKGKNPNKVDTKINVKLNGKNREIKDIKCKDVYWEYVGKISKLPKAEQKWNDYLDTYDIIWQDHYVIPFKVNRERSV